MTNPPEIPQLLAATQPLAVPPGEAARLIGIGRTMLYEEIASGRLRSAKVGKRRIITLDWIREYLSSREESAGAGDRDER